MTEDKKYLILMAGLPGTGKTTVSEKLSKELGYTLINQNSVRREHGMKKMPKTQENVLRDVDRRVHDALARGEGVIVDAANRYGHRRHQFYGIASGFGMEVVVLECVCSEDTAKARIKERPRGDGLIVDAYDPSAYDKVRAGFEEVEADFHDFSNHVSHLVLNTETKEIIGKSPSELVKCLTKII